MMDATIEKSLIRGKRISAVEIALREIENREDLELNMNEFVIKICEQFVCSERTAKEYIKIAQSRI